MSQRFKHLEVHDWRQFEHVEIDFHNRLTVITGANGAGKTTLLNILGMHFGWNISVIATKQQSKTGIARYFSGLRRSTRTANEDIGKIGHLLYDDNLKADISIPETVDQAFNVNIHDRQPVEGVFLSSHRPVYTYQAVTQIPTSIDAREQMYSQYRENMFAMHQPQSRYDSPSYRLKSSLISLATFGYGNQVVESDTQAIATFEGFEAILKKVLPKRLGFQRLLVRMPEVIIGCEDSEFSLDAASGGVAALIDVSWQLYLKSLIDPEFVTVFDEPENHLHPEMQREIMPGLLQAFPGVQFIVATHNPFVVTSVEDSSVVILDYENSRVVSRTLTDVDRSASSDRVLMDVLGLPAPIPLWVEERLDQIMNEFADRELTSKTLRDLRAALNQAGLNRVFPDVIERLEKGKD